MNRDLWSSHYVSGTVVGSGHIRAKNKIRVHDLNSWYKGRGIKGNSILSSGNGLAQVDQRTWNQNSALLIG